MCLINPLPHNKALALTKLKAFTDDKWNISQNIEFVFHMVENIVEKGENSIFFLFQQYFENVF